MNLDFNDITRELDENNLNAGGGIIERGEQRFLVRSIGLFEKPETLEHAVIATREEIPIHVNDIRTVQFGARPRLGKVGLNTNDDVVEGIVLLRKGSDTIGTCTRIKERMKYLNENVLPTSTTDSQVQLMIGLWNFFVVIRDFVAREYCSVSKGGGVKGSIK